MKSSLPKVVLNLSLICLWIATPALAGDAAIEAFIDTMVLKHGFERKYVEQTLGHAKKQDRILETMSRAAERTKPWYEYRKIFVIPKRIMGGVDFWKRNQVALERAERMYGVPAEIIVAIIGVETYYGANTGSTKVLDALYTLGFFHPTRNKFFRTQLEEFLLLAREEQVDPATLSGSYAGAMGRAQFMPDSFRSYAVDFDGDGKRDIWNSDADAIGSVANYFRKKGHWNPGQPITTRVGNVNQSHQKLVEAGTKPQFTLGDLRRAGITVDRQYPDALPTSLIELRNSAGMEYWAGLDNFYAITRYNNSRMYAMVVFQLANEIRESL